MYNFTRKNYLLIFFVVFQYESAPGNANLDAQLLTLGNICAKFEQNPTSSYAVSHIIEPD